MTDVFFITPKKFMSTVMTFKSPVACKNDAKCTKNNAKSFFESHQNILK